MLLAKESPWRRFRTKSKKQASDMRVDVIDAPQQMMPSKEERT
jgi:hypothetical protein